MVTASKPDDRCIDCDGPLVACDCAPGCIGSKCSAGCDDSLPHAFRVDEPELTDEGLLAQRDGLADSLEAVLTLIDHGAFQWPTEQAIVNDAVARLAELGRGKPDALREKAEQWAVGKERG